MSKQISDHIDPGPGVGSTSPQISGSQRPTILRFAAF